jgi:hypothetical protein
MAPAIADAGFEVAYEQTVTEAIDRLQTYAADVAVLPTADAMPEFVVALRRLAPRCRVLAVQAADAEQVALPDGTVALPADPDEFVAALWRATPP